MPNTPSFLTKIIGAVSWLGSGFSDYKTLFERSISIHDDAVHVMIGIVLQLLAAVLLRKSITDLRALLFVLGAEIINETNDILQDLWPSAAMQLGESMKDLLLTMALPAVLFVVARRWPWILGHQPRASKECSAECCKCPKR
jgi:hypothetical protein